MFLKPAVVGQKPRVITKPQQSKSQKREQTEDYQVNKHSRKFLEEEWKPYFPWIVYNEEMGTITCQHCVEFTENAGCLHST